MSTATAEQSSEYHLIEALITSDRAITGVDIARLVNAMKIYEHIEKPYLTMTISFADEENVVQDFGEKPFGSSWWGPPAPQKGNP